ncbi:hypothetical protein QQ054_10700 [Oscillatoria amoena NRMC-F 0135]|nr:hypothetical protein [Oscillatoria amoena NRMC-F 0135]
MPSQAMQNGENYGTMICYDSQMIVEVRITDFNDPDCKTMQPISYDAIPDGLITEEYKQSKKIYQATQAAKSPSLKIYLLASLGYLKIAFSIAIVYFFAVNGERPWFLASLLFLTFDLYTLFKSIALFKKLSR